MPVVKSSIEFTTEDEKTIYLDKKSNDCDFQLMISEVDNTGERNSIYVNLTKDELRALLQSLKSMNEL